MSELNTTPSFLFEQLDEDSMTLETPIEVVFWKDGIELRQRDNGYVMIEGDINNVKLLLKQIIKHYPEAKRSLDK